MYKFIATPTRRTRRHRQQPPPQARLSSWAEFPPLPSSTGPAHGTLILPWNPTAARGPDVENRRALLQVLRAAEAHHRSNAQVLPQPTDLTQFVQELRQLGVSTEQISTLVAQKLQDDRVVAMAYLESEARKVEALAAAAIEVSKTLERTDRAFVEARRSVSVAQTRMHTEAGAQRRDQARIEAKKVKQLSEDQLAIAREAAAAQRAQAALKRAEIEAERQKAQIQTEQLNEKMAQQLQAALLRETQEKVKQEALETYNKPILAAYKAELARYQRDQKTAASTDRKILGTGPRLVYTQEGKAELIKGVWEIKSEGLCSLQ